MSRILLATIGSLGDLHPLISIGLELRQRGNEVRFCSSEVYRQRIEALGFGFDSLRPNASPENETGIELVREIMDPKHGVERLLRGVILPELKATYADLLKAVTGPPRVDLIVAGELIYPAPMIGEKLGIPWASAIMSPMSFFSAHDLPVLPPVPKFSSWLRRFGPVVNGKTIQLIKWSTRSWSQPVRALRKELGLGPGQNPIHEGKFSPHLVLALFSPILAQPQPDWPRNTVVTGFPFYDGSSETSPLPCALTKFLEEGEPPIVFTLGTSAVLDPGTFYEEAAAASAAINRRAVLLIGRNPPPPQLQQGVVAFSYARYSELFPRAAAVAHQGGIGTTGQAMRAGCPMLIMPYNFDQPDNAARIFRLGLGQTISRRAFAAPDVAERLGQLLHIPSYRAKAAIVSKAIRKENGVAVACESLERLLH